MDTTIADTTASQLGALKGRAVMPVYSPDPTVPSAASVLGLSRSKAYDLAGRKNAFPVRRLGSRIVVPVPAFLQWLGLDPAGFGDG
jgi:predicted DNA-binding transcriptional regulator AlpA